jgi:hypothetical protein
LMLNGVKEFAQRFCSEALQAQFYFILRSRIYYFIDGWDNFKDQYFAHKHCIHFIHVATLGRCYKHGLEFTTQTSIWMVHLRIKLLFPEIIFGQPNWLLWMRSTEQTKFWIRNYFWKLRKSKIKKMLHAIFKFKKPVKLVGRLV